MEIDELEETRPAKRVRSLDAREVLTLVQSVDSQQPEEHRSLLSLPDGVLYYILSALSSSSLLALSNCCKTFRTRDPDTGLSLIERIAKESLVRRVGAAEAARWRSYTWLQRLAIEETVTLFDRERSRAQHFDFKELPGTSAVAEIRLDQPGPRMLLSDASTAESPVLRWQLLLRGNNAAEFGVIPVDMQDQPKALHKCQANKSDERASGFSSAITVGSLLPARLPVMKHTVVEVLVTPREVAFIVSNPEDGAEMIWQNNSTISRPYKGPRELRLQLPFAYTTPVKLAVTAWQRAAFDVLHTLSPEQRREHLMHTNLKPPPAPVAVAAPGAAAAAPGLGQAAPAPGAAPGAALGGAANAPGAAGV